MRISKKALSIPASMTLEVTAKVNQLKSEGKLDTNSLNSLKSTLSPFLNSEQNEMLKSLIEAINEQK